MTLATDAVQQAVAISNSKRPMTSVGHSRSCYTNDQRDDSKGKDAAVPGLLHSSSGLGQTLQRGEHLRYFGTTSLQGLTLLPRVVLGLRLARQVACCTAHPEGKHAISSLQHTRSQAPKCIVLVTQPALVFDEYYSTDYHSQVYDVLNGQFNQLVEEYSLYLLEINLLLQQCHPHPQLLQLLELCLCCVEAPEPVRTLRAFSSTRSSNSISSFSPALSVEEHLTESSRLGAELDVQFRPGPLA
ncbi:hypothetical protein INR49_018137 [Caranx melampygus]|nr:hypothetical protein INR49_018137 [Caranx melampygus]